MDTDTRDGRGGKTFRVVMSSFRHFSRTSFGNGERMRRDWPQRKKLAWPLLRQCERMKRIKSSLLEKRVSSYEGESNERNERINLSF